MFAYSSSCQMEIWKLKIVIKLEWVLVHLNYCCSIYGCFDSLCWFEFIQDRNFVEHLVHYLDEVEKHYYVI